MAALAAVMSTVLLTAACAPDPGSGNGVIGTGPVDVAPSSTDPAIRNEPLAPSFAIRASGTPRDRLVVLFNGTSATPKALSVMAGKLAADGYHVIGLRYESGTGTQAACPNSQRTTNPECHREFRSEVVFGAGVADPDGIAYNHPAVSVSRSNSVMNRLIKMLDYLDDRYPTGGWRDFQVKTAGVCTQLSDEYGGCEVDWTKLVMMGHSQGAGVGLYLAKFHPVARVGLLSGPYDAFTESEGSSSFLVAPWITDGDFVVPPSRIVSFVHRSDYGVTLQRAIATALSLAGPETNVTTTARPFGGVERLTTSVTPACVLDSNGAHSATATDLCSPSNVHVDTWRYMAGGS